MRLYGTNLSAQRGGETLFSNLDFTLHEGQLMTVTGPNGTGKSTLLRIISGLLEPSDGTVHLEEEDLHFKTGPVCHYLGAQNAMKSVLTVFDNLSFWANFQGEQQMSVHEALEQVKLPGLETLPYGVLSTGQKRRVAIARLLVSFRPLWVVDEPTSGLDSHATALFSTLMAKQLENGGMIVAATHLPLGLKEHVNIAIHDFIPEWGDAT